MEVYYFPHTLFYTNERTTYRYSLNLSANSVSDAPQGYTTYRVDMVRR